MKITGNNWTYHCFNCGHKCSYVRGRRLSRPTRELLLAFGLDIAELSAINLDSLQFLEDGNEPESHEPEIIHVPEFSPTSLPPGELLDPTKASHKVFAEYLTNRAISPTSYPFYVTQDQTRPGITIPFTHNNQIVGHTTRYLDSKKPKYFTDSQPGYMFGMDFQREKWNIALVMEGPLCALSIDGIAYLHQTMSEQQIKLLTTLQKEIIVVPDQDLSGMTVIDQALEHGFSVSIPQWPDDIKDVNDAVRLMGKLGTLMTILDAAESSELKIYMKSKWLEHKIARQENGI